ncbi:MAG: hypothetical protein E2O61_15470 [Gammaproteobacteria bacterium]|nr:MAG: hypothetical protein E2O61_15470 [Gammaproteobacteria bacterium]
MMELMWASYEFSGRSEHEASMFEPIPTGETLYLTKKPPDTTRMRKAFLADDELFVIAMLRDPRAAVSSRHPIKPGVYFSSFRRWQKYADAMEVLNGHPRFLVVRYEDLVSDPDRVQTALEEQFDFLTAKGRFADYPEGVQVSELARGSLNGVRPFDPSRIDSWRQHLPRVKGQLAVYPELLEILVQLDYEPNADWTSVLDGVETYAQSYKEEEPNWLKRQETSLRYWFRSRRYLRDRGL